MSDAPIIHRVDEEHGNEPVWVEVLAMGIVIHFVKNGSGVKDTSRLNFLASHTARRPRTFLPENIFRTCRELAQKTLHPEPTRNPRHWADRDDDGSEDSQPKIIVPPPEQKPHPEPEKGPAQRSLF